MLHWQFSYDYHYWYAFSAAFPATLAWNIGVCNDGTFDVSKSDSKLLGPFRLPTFKNLQAAKDFCEAWEARHRKQTRIQEPIP
jgi:hypothetical protein